ncbi:hypothetical protein Y032_0342g3032 [Ancylostoma ceylanicum]|uniref:Uncharacterized protein n=1 Tax=Ancylostoma ceylanicum TaxID=53326 RepID=A0A016RXL4_9BILA|nr:hypothetical protein Y032_0342g3032 [Ancylostoma ceylanicum]
MSLRRHIFRNETTEPTVHGCMAEQHRAKCHDGAVIPLARTGAQQELVKENPCISCPSIFAPAWTTSHRYALA